MCDLVSTTPSLRRALAVASFAAAAALANNASALTLLQPFAASGSAPAAPWRVLGLPHQTKPFTRFSVVDLDARRALRVEADASYGNLVHSLQLSTASAHLAWQWRVDEPNPAVDLHVRAGEDTALRICVLWDLALGQVPFFERQFLRLARANADMYLPAATVCYVWDAHLPPGAVLDSPFTRRLRFIVLRSGDAPLHQWTAERRDIVADFRKLFGTETDVLPPIIGIAVGADADNTHGHSLAHVADLLLEP
jgi:hypothetical protein